MKPSEMYLQGEWLVSISLWSPYSKWSLEKVYRPRRWVTLPSSSTSSLFLPFLELLTGTEIEQGLEQGWVIAKALQVTGRLLGNTLQIFTPAHKPLHPWPKVSSSGKQRFPCKELLLWFMRGHPWEASEPERELFSKHKINTHPMHLNVKEIRGTASLVWPISTATKFKTWLANS